MVIPDNSLLCGLIIRKGQLKGQYQVLNDVFEKLTFLTDNQNE